MNLPEEFLMRMKALLQEEYDLFLRSYEEPRRYGLRVNTLKVRTEEFRRIAPFHLKQIPWIENGFFYEREDAPARHPFYYAGLYYLQEPSAMLPAAVLPVSPGERVLDLCAAPGGKATALAAKLQGSGLLVANDISASRAKALLKNLEVSGVVNSFVTNTTPANLAAYFPESFDKILVDAPCSGEGMFRKDIANARAWSLEKVHSCAKLQKEIANHAVSMLRPGGTMLYSTCTFSPEENEQVIADLLLRHPELELLPIPQQEGFAAGRPELAVQSQWERTAGEAEELPDRLRQLHFCVRLFPHRVQGEGHFLALLHKKENPAARQEQEDFFSGFAAAATEPGGITGRSGTAAAEPGDITGRTGTAAAEPGNITGRTGAASAEPGSITGRIGTAVPDPEALLLGKRDAKRSRREAYDARRKKGRQKQSFAGQNTARGKGAAADDPALLEQFFAHLQGDPGDSDRKASGKPLPEPSYPRRTDGCRSCGLLPGEEFFYRAQIRGGQAYLPARGLQVQGGIPFLRNGLYLGELKKGRFEPSQALAMALNPEGCACVLDFDAGDDRLRRYLCGETIDLENALPGASGTPAMSAPSGLPAMSGSSGMPAVPGSFETPAESGSSGMPAVPGSFETPAESGSSGTPAESGSSASPSASVPGGLSIPCKRSGWQLVCVQGYPLGWGKLVNGTLKNKYHSGWRMQDCG